MTQTQKDFSVGHRLDTSHDISTYGDPRLRVKCLYASKGCSYAYRSGGSGRHPSIDLGSRIRFRQGDEGEEPER